MDFPRVVLFPEGWAGYETDPTKASVLPSPFTRRCPSSSRPRKLSDALKWTILALLLIATCFYAQSGSPPYISSIPSFSHTQANSSSLPDLYEASLYQLQVGLDAGDYTSVDLVKTYIARIMEVDQEGSNLKAVLEINELAVAEAQLLDEERKFFGSRGVMHGIPVLLKDNIATISSEGMNTTAGSYALLNSIVPRDAGVVTRLRHAGAIILGKANMDEFASGRGELAEGWSGRGRQTTAAYYPGQNPCGSSGGSGVATSIGLTAVSLGTETGGSITCPASYNNIVGIKPTVGLTSRAGVIPLLINQDTVGPMARSVSDAAALLSVIAGTDTFDNYTFGAPNPIPPYNEALRLDFLRGKRLGIPRYGFLDPARTPITHVELDAFDIAVHEMGKLGATIVDDTDLPSTDGILAGVQEYKSLVGPVDFKLHLEAYLAGLIENPTGVRTIEQLVVFNDAHPELEEPPGFEEQDFLRITANATGRTPEYYHALAHLQAMGRERGIDWVMNEYHLDGLILPANAHPYRITGIAGYPSVTVPLGFYPSDTVPISKGPGTVYPAPNAPFGLTFFGKAWSEFDLIGFAYAFEQATQTRLEQRAFKAALPKAQLPVNLGQ